MIRPEHPQRLDRIDALRAVAMLWMTAYHFAFDLDHFRLIEQDFHRDPFWTWQRTAIVSLFLFTAGLSQAVAVHQGQTWARFWRRWLQVAGAAVLVTAGSLLVFPKSDLLTLLRSDGFRRDLGMLPGYDPSYCGKVQTLPEAFEAAHIRELIVRVCSNGVSGKPL